MKHYRKLGYECKCFDIIDVKTEDLTLGSNYLVEVICDYCENPYMVKYVNYIKYQKSEIKKDACKKCGYFKMQEAIKNKYGIKNINSLDIIKDKTIKTNLKRYGVKHHTQDENVKEKMKIANVNKYGYECVLNNEDIKTQIKNTNIEKFGCENVFANEAIKEKIGKTNLRKYGCINPMQNKEIAAISMGRNNLSKSRNNSQICSKPQRAVYDIIGGELNFLYEKFWLDIAFPEECVYVEYDGSGHDMSVKFKKISKEDFELKEIKRYEILKSYGWNKIAISTKKDFVPDKDVLISMIDFAKNLMKNDEYDWVTFDIDAQNIQYKDTIINYNYLPPFIL